ncbi:MAG: glycoside hydrolase family 20 zincin-like fold domain-containing protein [Flavobacteriaceae bacterium]|nr:glycoside hydrolase family 20 zincin-like fold domain-containing protein [Flavobacteriaceae bacterium]
MRQLVIFLITFLLIGCSNKIENLDGFKLLPSVQELEYNNDFSNLNFENIKFAYSTNNTELPIRLDFTNHIENNKQSESTIDYSIDSSLNLNQEGYTLNITKNKISIVAKDEKGLFYAFITLDQLIEDSKDQNINLPMVSIKDYPSLKFRPIHIDVKHHMEKKSYYFNLIDHLAKQKINGIIVEFEDKLKYELRPEIGAPDALSIEWWIELSEYAFERNIMINPLVQGLGHASFILKHEKNKHLRDVPNSDWAFNPLNSETYDLQFDLYLDAIKATPFGKYFHVGGDEVHLLKREGKSELELNLIWLNKVCQFAEKHNRIPIFWDDMPLKHAGVYRPMFNSEISKEKVDEIWEKNELNLMQFIEKFPKNAIYMRWNYQKSDTYGNQKAMDWYTNNNLKVMGATAGQTRWTLMPQNQSNIPQIRSFAISSIEKNLEGLLLTLWDDDSPHFELYKRGIAAFAQYTWSGNKKSIDEFKGIYRHRIYGSEFSNNEYAFIDKLEKPVGLWLNMLLEDKVRRAAISKQENPLETFIIDLPDLENKGMWSKKYFNKIENAKSSLLLSKEIEETIDKIMENEPKNKFTLEVYKQVNELVKFSSNIIIALEKLDLSKEIDYPIKTELNEIRNLEDKFNSLRKNIEEVYSKTRILEKPNSYILDQDHHNHPANQSKNFDWQFFSEIFLLEKIKNNYKNEL